MNPPASVCAYTSCECRSMVCNCAKAITPLLAQPVLPFDDDVCQGTVGLVHKVLSTRACTTTDIHPLKVVVQKPIHGTPYTDVRSPLTTDFAPAEGAKSRVAQNTEMPGRWKFGLFVSSFYPSAADAGDGLKQCSRDKPEPVGATYSTVWGSPSPRCPCPQHQTPSSAAPPAARAYRSKGIFITLIAPRKTLH